ncbi:type I-E CRISPR-associated protein Cas6/Cse3/CasE [Erwinia oleae]|uniref:type I-E CRISPR-associated protein Cas6/Cse3/CasE n=1 Tax=Erwinia oleae TaxID=796334 RepID=UPI00054E6010|nr:type I-E CRISPR-associated protein Cas6/Cse3/CasE [Erwinia oleae]
MYLSRIQLRLERLKPSMLEKWRGAASYAGHQWLWQLFPQQETRPFLFRQEPKAGFFVLSETLPLPEHALFSIETKPFNPHLEVGLELSFQLRANPVVCKNNKRCDVMMDAKFQAKANGIAQQNWWELQTRAAHQWLERQGDQHGFSPVASSFDEFALWAGSEEDLSLQAATSVKAYQQHRLQRKANEPPIRYSSVDFSGRLTVTDVALFQQALFHGIGKSKALGCGLLMIKR